MSNYDIAFYGSHNAAFAISKDDEIIDIIEIERLINEKNNGLAQYKTFKPDDILFYAEYLGKYLTEKYGIEKFRNCYHQNTEVVIGEESYNLFKRIPAEKYISCKHHESHAAGSFYQSKFNDALIISFDGGGNDGFFNIYLGNRTKGVHLLEAVNHPKSDSPHEFLDLGFPYMVFGHYIDEIKQEVDVSAGNLVYPGKLMGLSSFGNIIEEWLPHFIDFYQEQVNGTNYRELLNELGSKINVEFDRERRILGEVGRNVAATSQRAFEEVFLIYTKKYLDKYNNLPVCIAGGCGLNIILNTRLTQELGKNVFVGPNPNDCGLAAGMLLNEIKPQHQVKLTYKGETLRDIDTVGEYIHQAYYCISSILDLDKLADELVSGKIVGVARGRGEHGPRALGNRSILCNPAIEGMKDTLNHKVKNRESYRPFAPVVRLEDVNRYFQWDSPSEFMSFCPIVREEWRDKLAAITHVDNTARVQTVTPEQNKFLYDLLTIIAEKTGVGVLLNTSFNVAGKPILNSVKDAFTIFENTQMDSLVIENIYMTKYNGH